MENRPLSVAAQLSFGLLFAAAAWAAEDGPSAEQVADWDSRMSRAMTLQSEGKAKQATAKQAYEDQEKACFKTLLVNKCRADARKIYIAESRAGQNIENEGKAIERLVRKEQLNDRDARAAAAAPQKAAAREAQKAETEAAREEAEATRAGKLADHERRAAEGQRRRAAEAERQQQKRAEHEAKQAAGRARAERRAAEAAQKMP